MEKEKNKTNKGWIEKEQHLSLKTEFKKGQHPSIKTEFKKGKGFWTGKKRPPFSKEWRENMGGKRNHNWKGGINPINDTIRKSFEYRNWRMKVFTRDNFTCQKCKLKSGNGKRIYLHAHHIKSFAKYPKLRFKVSNGRTLCRECHKITTSNLRKKICQNQLKKR